MTREQAIAHGKEQLEVFGGEHREFIEMSIKALEQEPFINKPCVSNEVCEHDKQKMLAKIRAEITNYKLSEDMLKDMDEDSIKWGMAIVVELLDKYKAEMEDT